MLMYANEFKTRKKQKLTEIKNLLQQKPVRSPVSEDTNGLC